VLTGSVLTESVKRSVTQTTVIKTVGVGFGEGVGGTLKFPLLVFVLAILVTLPLCTIPVNTPLGHRNERDVHTAYVYYPLARMFFVVFSCIDKGQQIPKGLSYPGNLQQGKFIFWHDSSVSALDFLRRLDDLLGFGVVKLQV